MRKSHISLIHHKDHQKDQHHQKDNHPWFILVILRVSSENFFNLNILKIKYRY